MRLFHFNRQNWTWNFKFLQHWNLINLLQKSFNLSPARENRVHLMLTRGKIGYYCVFLKSLLLVEFPMFARPLIQNSLLILKQIYSGQFYLWKGFGPSFDIWITYCDAFKIITLVIQNLNSFHHCLSINVVLACKIVIWLRIIIDPT